MRGIWWTMCLSLLVFVYGGCGQQNRYELQQTNDGRTIRLDKQTGETVVVVGDRLVPLRTPADTDSLLAALARPRTWPTRDFPAIKVKNPSLTTMYRDSSMHYILSITPWPRYWNTFWKKRRVSSLRIEFLDADGFFVVGTSTVLSPSQTDMENGGITMRGSEKCTPDEYASFASFTLK